MTTSGAGTGGASGRLPVLLTVDHDGAVSRAVARDLRRQYGERYRVVRADSGLQGLETLQQLALRGDRTAVLLPASRCCGSTAPPDRGSRATAVGSTRCGPT